MSKTRHQGLALLFEHRDYAKRWFGGLISSFGSQMGWIALIWLVMKLSGGVSAIGLVTLLYQLPGAIFAPIAGVVLDRFARARIMALANIFLGIVFVAIPTIAITIGSHALWLIYVLITLAGMTVPFDTIGSAPLISDLIPSERLSQANFFSQTVWQIASLVGPGLGGVLIGVVGPSAVLYADAGTFLFLGLMMWTIRTGQRPVAVNARDSSLASLYRGIRYLLQKRSLLTLAILSFLFYLFYGPYEVILPDLARTHFSGPAVLGLMWFAFSVGATGGGLWFSAQSWKIRLSVSLVAVIVAWGFVTIGMAYATHDVWLVSGLMLIGGLSYAPWGALVATARQHIVPPNLQGRVFGASALISAGGTPIGAWMTGLVLPFVQPSRLFLMAGITTVLVGVVGVLLPSLREMDAQVNA